MLVVVLAGGRGSRLGALTRSTPKPLVSVGGEPILSHVLTMYRSAGVSRALVAAGYLSEQISGAFANDESVQVVDTGLQTGTAGRLLRLADQLPETFCLAYSDSVSDVNIADVIRFHREQGRLATITAVRPPARYGVLTLDGDRVTRFAEKDPKGTHWINGGLMVLERRALAYIERDAAVLESDVLPRLAQESEITAFRHRGFWWGMDTVGDVAHLNHLWKEGLAPWRPQHTNS